jgi:hypothetical protein
MAGRFDLAQRKRDQLVHLTKHIVVGAADDLSSVRNPLQNNTMPATLFQAPRLTDVLSRVETDINSLLSPSSASILQLAVQNCLRCTRTWQCDAWISTHEEGEPNQLPLHCPMARLVAARDRCQAANDR